MNDAYISFNPSIKWIKVMDDKRILEKWYNLLIMFKKLSKSTVRFVGVFFVWEVWATYYSRFLI